MIKKLIDNNVKLNITAIFTIEQIKEILGEISKTQTILSIFAGRIFDIGLNANERFYEMANYIKENSDCLSLWASCRMPYDFINAKEVNANIITMPPEMIKKISFFGKDPLEYSKDTVKMFYNDAKSSNFKI